MVGFDEAKVKPLVVCSSRGIPQDFVHITGKGFRKTIEQNTLWCLHAESGTLLPYREGAKLIKIEDKDSWCIAVMDFQEEEDETRAVEITGKDSKSTDSVLDRLASVIAQRKADMPEGSYTSYLFKSGEEKIKKKTGEEAVELLLALDDDDIVHESADLIYHLLVLLESKNIPVSAVYKELASRAK
ncbi:MAG: phosphoribosyl-ATP diphosphatase [Spirochaetia bacterium]